MWVDADGNFEYLWRNTASLLLGSPEVKVGEVQSTKLPDLDSFTTLEAVNCILQWPVPRSIHALMEQVKPNIPWAEEQFLERVSGEPLNPPPSHERWPHAEGNNERHIKGGQFDHTYPERFWPKYAISALAPAPIRCNKCGEVVMTTKEYYHRRGIRFKYGDLHDVVLQLCKNEMTRQAYLPIFFPEDTGATQGQRVPCTLGYHFLYRDNNLNITYFIRSCDFWKHFRDDVYMAARLCQWMVDQLRDADPELIIYPGVLNMHTVSMHLFKADVPKVEEVLRARQG